jgi:hypothetical protein
VRGLPALVVLALAAPALGQPAPPAARPPREVLPRTLAMRDLAAANRSELELGVGGTSEDGDLAATARALAWWRVWRGLGVGADSAWAVGRLDTRASAGRGSQVLALGWDQVVDLGAAVLTVGAELRGAFAGATVDARPGQLVHAGSEAELWATSRWGRGALAARLDTPHAFAQLQLARVSFADDTLPALWRAGLVGGVPAGPAAWVAAELTYTHLSGPPDDRLGLDLGLTGSAARAGDAWFGYGIRLVLFASVGDDGLTLQTAGAALRVTWDSLPRRATASEF